MRHICFDLKYEDSEQKTSPLVLDSYDQWLCYVELAWKVNCLTRATNTITLGCIGGGIVNIVVSNFNNCISELTSEEFYEELKKKYKCRWVRLWDVFPGYEELNPINTPYISEEDYRGNVRYEVAYYGSISELCKRWNRNEVTEILKDSEWLDMVMIGGQNREKEPYQLYDLKNYTFEIDSSLNWGSISEPLYSINSANFLNKSKRIHYEISNGYFKMKIYIHDSLLS